MTSAAHRLLGLGAVVFMLAFPATPSGAQVVDTTKVPPVPVVRADSGKPAVTAPVVVRRPAQPLGGAARQPPITPKRAFLYSLMLPGLGQSRLDRGTAGALFAAIELGSFAMIRKSGIDLRQARRFSGDSVPANYTVGADGKIVGTSLVFPPQFESDLVSTRRLHKEDWYAAILFNHLLAGADAFVAAQLWDAAPKVSLRPYADGLALVATIHW